MTTLYDLRQEFDAFLDEVYPDYCVGNLTYPASKVLKDCDAIAYNEMLYDWLDSQDIDTDELPEY